MRIRIIKKLLKIPQVMEKATRLERMYPSSSGYGKKCKCTKGYGYIFSENQVANFLFNGVSSIWHTIDLEYLKKLPFCYGFFYFNAIELLQIISFLVLFACIKMILSDLLQILEIIFVNKM